MDTPVDQEQLKSIIGFLQRAENLKNTIRSANTSNGRPESTAEHSWRLCLMVMVFSQYFEGAEAGRLLRLAVIHDLGEALCGDVPAPAQSAREDKSGLERQALRELCAELPEALRSELLELWEEYEAAATLEARIVKGLDKLETIMQHNQGLNPPGFDYGFNLSYGQGQTSSLPLLQQIRQLLDEATRENATGK
jgi:Predicted hydrolases of HD superfamily